MQPDATRLRSIIAAAGVEAQTEEIEHLGLVLHVPLDGALPAIAALKSEGYSFMVDLFGADTGERIQITYHLRSFGREEDVFLRTEVEYDGVLPSVWSVLPAAAFPEREAAELFGMKLSGHPNPRRLLTSEDCLPYLRKDVAVRTAEEVRRR